MPALVFERHAALMRGRKVLFFLDNTVALQCMVKGGAGHAALDRSVAYTCFLRGCGHIQAWFEFVDSQGNWSDEISRGQYGFVRRHGFPVHRFTPAASIWRGSVMDAWRRAQRLCMRPHAGEARGVSGVAASRR